MQITSICILGGTGFVGRAIADQLSPSGVRVRVVMRSAPRAAPLTVLPTVEIMVGDVHDKASLQRAFEDMDAVVNLVGILHPGRGYSFEKVHAELPRKVTEACLAAGVRRLLHMSALGASDDAPSDYLRSKARGEAAVRQSAGILPFTILRPSVIFGPDDRFVNLFATLARWFPVIPLAGAKARFQPIWVEDVARAFAAALGDSRTFGETYNLCGPKAYTLEEIVHFVARAIGRDPRVLALPDGLASLQAFMLERLPGKLMTRDNLRSMSVDNVCAGPFPEVFGFVPSPMEAVVAEYLAGTASRARYSQFRHNAGR
ncbi:MAG: complex I NDUFA9 subunit family protein [Usitatibacter sp.]